MKAKTILKAIFFLLGIFLSMQGLLAQDLHIKAYVSSTKIPLDQQFELNVELSGKEANKVPQPALPDIEDFAAFRGTSSSQNVQIVNTQMSVTVTYTHRFIATKIGKFEIPPVKLEYGGKKFTTDPIPIEIVKGQPSQPRSGTSNRGSTDNAEDLSQLLFLRASVDKNRVYQNEPVTVSYKIYTSVNISSYGISQLPNTVGFWSEEFPTPSRPPLHAEVVNGRRYQVAEIKKVALFPQGPGTKTLDPMVIECEVRLRNRRRSRDIFDSFFDDPFFSLNRTTTKVIRSNPVKIDVLPLPAENKSLDFSGAVGDFSLSASVDKERVKTNEAVTLTVTISGTGNIKILAQPDVEFPSDFEVYDPKISENINRNGGQISGSKTFEYVLIPRFPGTQTIRPISFSYFDLSAKRYKTLSSDPINISVAKGKDRPVNVPLATSKEDVKFIGQDIRFIQTHLPEFQEIGTVFYKEVPFFAILILPLLVLAGAYGYSKHLEKMSTNVAYARSRKANQMALKRLRNANKEMGKGNLRKFYGEVSKALMGFIGDKLNVSAAGLITDEVDSVLRSRGIREETVANYLDCLRTCDFKRFAPSDADNGEMKVFFEKARKAIIALDKEI
ncbi:protein BatD [candidate division KSB1 bacterium]|nr:protein BatD [candidate division KSB1 bacterium]NIR71478.1 protein BatD [candidate division KSB1 bacterium]NIS23399.1 protein BatD [candidate division KSB1 bacterium]NIT70290.1 protein BatD [candidate division KSB1 bacterium]NIU24013.1 protein BatD [candidate division KSB1 bacterium]